MTVFSVPGLSVRMLTEHEGVLPQLSKIARVHSAASVVVVDGASPEQLESSLFTGVLPEYVAGGRGVPFWQAAEIPAHVEPAHPLRPEWRALAKQPRLRWLTRDLRPDVPAALKALDAEVAKTDGPLVVLSVWALADGRPAPQNAHPMDRPVLLARGFNLPKTCVGILEIGGILRRALTGEELTDAI